MIGCALQLILRKVPRAPFTGTQFLSTQTTTVNETTSTFSAVNIGDPHPDRIIVLAIFQGVNGTVTAASVNGEAMFHLTRINEFAIAACRVPNGTTATISVSATTSLRKAVGVYVAYPRNPVPMDFGSVSANTTTDANVANIKAQAGGFLVYSGGQLATLGAFTTTWNGPTDAPVENADAQLEAASSYTHGHVNFTTSTDQSDVNMAESVSGTKRLVVVSWCSARGY